MSVLLALYASVSGTKWFGRRTCSLLTGPVLLLAGGFPKVTNSCPKDNPLLINLYMALNNYAPLRLLFLSELSRAVSVSIARYISIVFSGLC